MLEIQKFPDKPSSVPLKINLSGPWGRSCVKQLPGRCISHTRAFIHVLATLLLIQLSASTTSESRTRWVKRLGLCPPLGRPRWSPRLLLLTWPAPGYCDHVGRDPSDANIPLSLSLFQITWKNKHHTHTHTKWLLRKVCKCLKPPAHFYYTENQVTL